MIDPPARGRIFSGEARVRLGDVSPKGRLRLDAAARYLQDIAADDGHDAIGAEADPWVVRRTTMHVVRFPVLRERITLTTWASGAGSRWAERRTSVVGERGGRIEAAALWVHVDLATGRPKRLSAEFWATYGDAVGGRTVHARLHHGDPPPGSTATAWPVRFADFDVLGHVNNAVYWAIVEELFDLRAPCTVTLEYRGGIDRGQAVSVVVAGDDLWVLAGGAVAATGRIEPPRLYSPTP